MQATALDSPAEGSPVDSVQRQGKYLIFHLGVEEFGIEALKVLEIMGLQDITTVPQVPNYVKGVINLRGKVIPVIDLRVKFGMVAVEYTSRTCVVVVRTRVAGEELKIGIIVDGVVEVLHLTTADMEGPPDFGHGIATPCLTGMAKIKGQVKILLEIDNILGDTGEVFLRTGTGSFNTSIH
jgi:purine-binding chemotaxis protein CheW